MCQLARERKTGKKPATAYASPRHCMRQTDCRDGHKATGQVCLLLASRKLARNVFCMREILVQRTVGLHKRDLLA